MSPQHTQIPNSAEPEKPLTQVTFTNCIQLKDTITYRQWRFQVRAIMNGLELFPFLDGTLTPPPKNLEEDFIRSGGPSQIDGAAAIIPNVIQAVNIARTRGILVVWVVREHDASGRDVELFRRHLYNTEKVGPAVKGHAGAELIEELEIKEGDYKLPRTRMSAFFSTHLHSVLLTAGRNSLVVVGIQTPNCIRQTVFDAVALDYPSVSVIVDATAAKTPEIHAANIFDIKNIGIATPTLEEWCKDDE